MKLREYEVLYVERAENTVYICRRPPEGLLYRVIEAADRRRIGEYIKYFSARRPKGFYEDFCLNEKYYAVFFAPNGASPDGASPKNAGEALTARGAVRALAMQNPPFEIAVRILSPEHIFVCGSELEFALDLPETDKKITREYFFEKLADFVCSFSETEADRDIGNWLDDLRRGKYDSLLTAYKRMPGTSEENARGKAERFKKLRELLPKVAAVIAAATAIIAAAAAISDRSGDDTVGDRINSLGTIDLRES